MTRLSSSACVALLLGADGLILAMLGRPFQFSGAAEGLLLSASAVALLWAAARAWRDRASAPQDQGQAAAPEWSSPSRLQEPAQGV